MKSQTYTDAATILGGSIDLGRDVAPQVPSWRGADNGERSQSREDSEERETHCDRVENRKTGGKLECLVDWASSFQVALSYTFLLLTEKAGALDPRLAAKREAEFFDPSTSNFCKQSPK